MIFYSSMISSSALPPGASRLLLTASVLTVLSGCAGVPTAVMLASLTGNGASYLTTGKGLPDHALSVVLHSDCASLRLLRGEAPCTPVTGAGNAAPPLQVSQRGDAASRPHPGERAPRRSRIGASASRFLVIGSFEIAANARLHQLHHAALPSRIVSHYGPDGPVYRVLVGPLSARDLPTMRASLAASGIDDAWLLDTCPGESADRACVSSLAGSPPASTNAG